LDNTQKVSILMNCYNGAKFLKEALDSVVAQTYTDWELIFVDNWSTDASVAMVESYADPRMKIFRTPMHCPLGEAREFGMGKCDGEYVAFLDTDDIWLAGKLDAQLQVMQSRADVGLVYGSFSVINAKGKKYKKRKLSAQYGDLLGKNLISYEVNFQSVLVSSWALAKVGKPFFKKALSFSPDYNLVMRILAQVQAVCLPEWLVLYRITGSSLTTKSIDRWGDEMQMTLDELLADCRNREKITDKEKKFADAKVAYYRAAAAMHHGNRALARDYLRGHTTTDRRYAVLYFATYYARLWAALHRFKGWVEICVE
jgi:glycosyltransferase involved in cell wall biosynthesis